MTSAAAATSVGTIDANGGASRIAPVVGVGSIENGTLNIFDSLLNVLPASVLVVPVAQPATLTRAIEERAEDLTQPGARERDATVERLPTKPLRDVEDAEAHVSALVAGDELDDAAEKRMGGVLPQRLEDAHREALEKELLGRDDLERVVRRKERVEHHLGAAIDVLDLQPVAAHGHDGVGTRQAG
jgi:hypothetical protein